MTRYTLLSLVWLALCWWIGRIADSSPVWVLILGTFAGAAPLLGYGLYRVTLNRIARAHKFNRRGLLYAFISARTLGYVLCFISSVLFGFLLLFWLASLNNGELLTILVLVALFPAVFTTLKKLLAREYRSFAATSNALLLSAALSSACLTLLYGLALFLRGPDAAAGSALAASSLVSLLESYGPLELDSDASYLGQVVSHYAGAVVLIKDYIAYHSWSATGYLFLAYLAGTFAMLFHVCAALSGFLIPASEYRRTVTALDDSESPGPVPMKSALIATLWATLLTVFIVPGMINSLELELRSNPAHVALLSDAEKQALGFAERIDDLFYRPGTIRAAETIASELQSRIEQNREQLAGAADAGFEAVRANVDNFLDYYYSLPGEYLRFAALLTNNLEVRLQEDLTRNLMAGDPFTTYESLLATQLAENEALRQEYQAALDRTLQNNRVPAPRDPERVLEVRALEELAIPVPTRFDLQASGDTSSRAAAGAISAAIVGPIVGKVAAKGTLKMASQAILKSVSVKVSSGAAGAAAGGVIGSVIPGAGTAVGIGIGFVSGLLTGFGVDALLLKLEENFNREQFREQILATVNEEEARLMALLRGPATNAGTVSPFFQQIAKL